MSAWTIVGKTVIVTGANGGIGKCTALELAKSGAAKVILACRNMKTAEEAAEGIRQQLSPTSTTKVVCYHLDLNSLASVRSFAGTVIEQEDRLDVLINNAGYMDAFGQTLDFNDDGNEVTFATNHLGHFLLTNLLLDLLKKSAPSRIVILSSEGYKFSYPTSKVHSYLAEVNTKKLKPGMAYALSKLCNLLHAQELHRRLENESAGVSVFAVHPGLIKSGLFRKMSWIQEILLKPFLWMFFDTVEAGAKTSIFCASEPGLENLSGNYFKYCAISEPWQFAQDAEAANRLWKVSEYLIRNHVS